MAGRIAPMTTTGSQLLTRALRQEGVDTIFTLAGDHILPLLDLLAQDKPHPLVAERLPLSEARRAH